MKKTEELINNSQISSPALLVWDFFVIFDLYSSEMPKFISYILISLIFLSCNKSKNFSIEKVDYRSNTMITAFCRFPDTVKVGETNVASYIFFNSTFDTIIEPRVKESVKYRFILFSEYFPENSNNFNVRYADSS